MPASRLVGPEKVALALAVSAWALLGGLAPASVAAGGDARAEPRLIQVSYEESKDGSSKRFNLSAFARHAGSVSFSVRHHHERLTANGRYNNHVTDTDIDAEDASHPWEVDRSDGGRRVLRAIRSSLSHDGAATIWVQARGNGARDKARVQVVVADCAQDPPLYPLSCEIKV